MKIKELKQELHKFSLRQNRSKQELLGWLGVPTSFEQETSYAKCLQELKLQKKPTLQIVLDNSKME